jgi:hypothetical protein
MTVDEIQRQVLELVDDVETIDDVEDAIKLIIRLSDVIDYLLPLARLGEAVQKERGITGRSLTVYEVNEIIRSGYRNGTKKDSQEAG